MSDNFPFHFPFFSFVWTPLRCSSGEIRLGQQFFSPNRFRLLAGIPFSPLPSVFSLFFQSLRDVLFSSQPPTGLSPPTLTFFFFPLVHPPPIESFSPLTHFSFFFFFTSSAQCFHPGLRCLPRTLPLRSLAIPAINSLFFSLFPPFVFFFFFFSPSYIELFRSALFATEGLPVLPPQRQSLCGHWVDGQPTFLHVFSPFFLWRS